MQPKRPRAPAMPREQIAVRFEDDPGRSVPLNLGLSCPPGLSPFCKWCTEEVLGFNEMEDCRPSTREKTAEAVDLVLANLIKAHQISRHCFVGISNSPNDYTETRYRQRRISYPNLMRVLKWMLRSDPPFSGFIPGYFDRRKPIPSGHVSRYRATERLLITLKRYLTAADEAEDGSINLSSLDRPATEIENAAAANFAVPSIWTPKLTPASDCIRLKDSSGEVEDYSDNEETNSMRQRLTEWNDFAAFHHIDILLKDDDFENLYQRHESDEEDEENAFFSDENDRPEFIQLERFRLHRVFNNSSFEQGGRLYAGWWQHVPSKFRRYITINGGPTKEFDYSNLHPAMLYAREGKRLEDDAYIIPGLESYRKLVKITLLKLINAPAEKRISPPKKTALPDGCDWAELQELVKAKHDAIAKYLRSGIGLILQKIDSEIAEDVMRAMMKKDYLVLPIHDSFITYSGLGETLTDVMKSSYHTRMKADVGVDADPTFLEQEISEEGLPSDEEYQIS